jgi:hypothetical protein
MAFATGMQARLPLGPLARGFLTTPQASLDAADWSVAPRPASTPGSRPTPGAALPGTLASPRAGLTPAGCRELVARLRRGALLSGGPRRPSYWTHIPAKSSTTAPSTGCSLRRLRHGSAAAGSSSLPTPIRDRGTLPIGGEPDLAATDATSLAQNPWQVLASLEQPTRNCPGRLVLAVDGEVSARVPM